MDFGDTLSLVSIDTSAVKEEMGTFEKSDETEGYTFTPAKDYFGTIIIPYTVIDIDEKGKKQAETVSARIIIEVSPVNDPPRMEIFSDSGTWIELDTASSLTLLRKENSIASDVRKDDSPNASWTVRFRLWDIDSPLPMNCLNFPNAPTT